MLPTMGSPLAYLLYCLNHASRPRASGMCFARSSGVLLRPLSRKKLHMQSRSLRKSFLAKRGMARPRLTGKPVIFSGSVGDVVETAVEGHEHPFFCRSTPLGS